MEVELPIECWELIFSYLHDYRHFEPISLTSKQFLDLTNRLRSFLSIPAHAPAAALLTRFHNLRSIDLSSYHLPADAVLLQIARSCSNLESLNLSNQETIPINGLRAIESRIPTLKVLILSNSCNLEDHELRVIWGLFPSLEELDISYPKSGKVSDAAVAVLSSNLKRLRKINISGNFFLSDHSIDALSTNCESLLEVGMRDCSFITHRAITSLIQNSPNLVSVNFDTKLSPEFLQLVSHHPFRCAKSLRSLDLSSSYVSDILLYGIAEADILLKHINLARSIGFTFHGIVTLLKHQRTIESFNLEGFIGITDDQMNELCPFLGNLTCINLSLCSNLNIYTFFNLLKSCCKLKYIKMENMKLEEEEEDYGIFGDVRNSQVRSLSFSKNTNLSDECLEQIVGACPNLESLNLSHCSNITEEGIKASLKRCSDKIIDLEISHCKGIKGLSLLDFDMPKLETLRAEGLDIGFQDLRVIGKRCYSLVQVNLRDCLNVSDEGVKELVRHCRRLREINLYMCNKVCFDCVAWMVFSRPSLRKIVVPGLYLPSEEMKRFLLHHGCLVS